VDTERCKGIQTGICGPTSPVQTPSPSSLGPSTAIAGTTGNFEPAREEAIVKIPPNLGLFFSNLFLVEKKGGGQRPVINLSVLNSFIHYHHFKMEDLKVAADILRPHDFMRKIDLKDAYFAVAIHPQYQ
jgi:hypothetical protein